MMSRSRMLMSMVVAIAVVASGCPGTFPPPPFSASGEYFGKWRGKSNEEDPQQVRRCPLTIALTQDTSAAYPQDHLVNGTITIDYSCIELPEWIDTPPPSVVNVSGGLQDNGNLTLISGGCTTALCVVLTLSGVGVDSDTDGFMDSYSGSWSYTILLAGVEPFGITGKFEVDTVAE